MANDNNMGGNTAGSRVFGRTGGNMTEEERRRLQNEGEQDSFGAGDQMGQDGSEMGDSGSAGTSGGGRDGSRSEGGDSDGGMGGSGMGY
jgi:hypothetical protein